MNSNLKNVEEAKLAARRLYKKVNFDGGNLQSYELNSMLQQTYQFLKIPFKPTTNDIKQYGKVLDSNGDGAVSLQDLQAMAVSYLCGQGVLSENQNKKALGNNSLLNKASYNQVNKYQPGTNPQHQPVSQSKYTTSALQHLTTTREIFKRNCLSSSQTITKDKVSKLLTQTYGALGRKGYYPSEQDVNVWMKLCDTNGDGHVEQEEYQYFVVRALERSGLKVYN